MANATDTSSFRALRVFRVLYCCYLPVIGYAQSTFGDIRGTARDPARSGSAASAR